jgi:hypothetical protein
MDNRRKVRTENGWTAGAGAGRAEGRRSGAVPARPSGPSTDHQEKGMQLSQEAIRRLMTKDEAEFIEGLAADRITQTTPTRLRQKLGRARRLRDKYRDLARRQAGEARGKQAPRRSRAATRNDNTLRKVQVFDWAIERIEAGLQKAGQGAPDEERAERERVRESPEYALEQLQPRIIEVLKEAEHLSFGDLWATVPDVPVDRLRKALWALSEAGAIDLTDDAGVALATEADVAEDVDVEVEIDRPGTPLPPPPGPRAVGRGGKQMPMGSGHHPKVRIRSHLASAGRRSQARRDRRG